MKKRLFEFTCPHCRHTFYLARDTYLIKEEKSAEYRHLKDQTFFMHQCQSCMKLFELDYPLIYRDPNLGYTLVLSRTPISNLEEGSILTKSPKQFLRAFSILDLNLDPASVLPVLLGVEKQRGKMCIPFDYDEKINLLWVYCGSDTVGIPHSFRHLK